MRHPFLTMLFVAAALAVSCGLGEAQYGPHGRFEPRWVNGLIDRVHDNLNRAYEGFRFTHDDRRRLDRAEHELREFARQWDRGRFDRGRLHESIESIRRVVDRNHMPRRDRDALYANLRELREMREAFDRHEIGRR